MLKHPSITPEQTDALNSQGWEYNKETNGTHLTFFTSSEDGFVFDAFLQGEGIYVSHYRWFSGGQGIEREDIWEGVRTLQEIISLVDDFLLEKDGFDILEYAATSSKKCRVAA